MVHIDLKTWIQVATQIHNGQKKATRFGVPLICSSLHNIWGRFDLWPFRSVAVVVCGSFGLWLFRFLAVSVCGLFGLWPIWFVADSVCGCLCWGSFGYLNYINVKYYQRGIIHTCVWLTTPSPAAHWRIYVSFSTSHDRLLLIVPRDRDLGV